MNSLSNASRNVAALVVSFFLTPFIINAVGNAAYGTWLVLLAVLGYATILEMGIQRATVKLVAEHRALEDFARMNRLIATAFYFFLGAGVLIALIMAFPIQDLLDTTIRDPGWRKLPRWVFLLLGVDVTCIFLNFTFTGIVYGLQLYHTKNVIDFASYILNAVLLVVFLQGGGLPALLLVKTGVDAAVLAATYVVAKRGFPDLSLSPRGVSPGSLRELMAFSGRLFLSSSMSRVGAYAQPIIIGARLSTEATAFFGVPRRLVDYAREIHWALATGFMPAFSDLHSSRNKEMVRSIYLRYSKYLLLVMAPILVLLYGYGSAFIARWIGPEYAAAGTGALYFLIAAYVAELAQPLLWSLFIGVGRLNLLTAVSSVGSLMTIVGSLLLIGPFGITGVAIAFFAVFLIQQIIFTVSLCSFLEISFARFAREVYFAPVGGGSLAAVLAWGAGATLGRASYASMGGGALVVVLGYALSVYLFFLQKGERSWLRGKARTLVEALSPRSSPSNGRSVE